MNETDKKKSKSSVRQRADAIKDFRCKNLIAVLECPTDVKNIGTVIRNANALGVEKVYVVDPRHALPDDWQELRERGSLSKTSVTPAKKTSNNGPITMTTRTASCHCGQLRLSCEGSPRKISMCHFADCKRRTGSAFSVAVFYARDQVRVTDGVARQWQRNSVSGFPVTFHFCGTCGSNVWWEPARMPDRVAAALGAFADPDFPPPEQSVRTSEKCPWLSLPSDVVQFADYPPFCPK